MHHHGHSHGGHGNGGDEDAGFDDLSEMDWAPGSKLFAFVVVAAGVLFAIPPEMLPVRAPRQIIDVHCTVYRAWGVWVMVVMFCHVVWGTAARLGGHMTRLLCSCGVQLPNLSDLVPQGLSLVTHWSFASVAVLASLVVAVVYGFSPRATATAHHGHTPARRAVGTDADTDAAAVDQGGTGIHIQTASVDVHVSLSTDAMTSSEQRLEGTRQLQTAVRAAFGLPQDVVPALVATTQTNNNDCPQREVQG